MNISIWLDYPASQKVKMCVLWKCAHPVLPASSKDGVYMGASVCVCKRERECVWVSVTHSPFVHKIMKSSYRVHLLRIQQLHIFQPLSTLHAGQIKCSERGLKKKYGQRKFLINEWINAPWHGMSIFFLFWRGGGHLEGFIVLPFFPF